MSELRVHWSEGMARFAVVVGLVALATSARAQDFDRDGIADGSDPCPGEMSMFLPSRMIGDLPLTLRVNELDPVGQIDWRKFTDQGLVRAERVSDGSPVPTSIVVFDTHDGVPVADSVRFYNGVGSVSIVLDNGAAEPVGDIRVIVSVGGVSVSKVVTLIQNPSKRVLSGNLTGSNLTWSAADGVVQLTGDVTVPTGQTLTIGPGTMVMVDPGPAGSGTRIMVNGRVDAKGTVTNPIWFFATAGAPAMHLTTDCTTEEVYNPYGWRGFFIKGTQQSVFDHVIVTGAGNSVRTGHTRGPIFQMTSGASINLANSAVIDNNGKCMYGNGQGTYNITNCLISRCGHGVEFGGNGECSALIEDTWITGIGHGPSACERDGDLVNFNSNVDVVSPPLKIRRCYLADGNDDGIDQQRTQYTIEDSVIWDIKDKGISMTSGPTASVTMINSLLFGTGGVTIKANDSSVHLYRSTVYGIPPLQTLSCSRSVVEESILWQGIFNSCCGTVHHSLLGIGSGSCGVGNMTVNPQFVDVAHFNFDLKPTSPALTAGPTGGRVGWTPIPAAPTGGGCAPANDLCDGAQPVSDGVTPVSTIHAETDGAVTACLAGDGQIHNDVWFQYTAQVNGTVTFSVCDAAFGARLAVYHPEVCGDPGSEPIGCDELSCSPGATVTVTMSQGEDLLLRLGSSTSGQEGEATLVVSSVNTDAVVAMTFLNTATVPTAGMVQNEDIVAYNPALGTWSLVMDGSDVGLGSLCIDALAILPVSAGGGILLSFSTDSNVPSLIGGPNGTLVDDADIVRFMPVSLGATTAGTLEFYFDGSDVGLDETNGSEDIDGLSVTPNGDLIMSMYGTTNVLAGNAQDEDLLRFVPSSLGAATAGTWSLEFDGSDVGLSTTADEDVDAVAVLSNGALLLSTLGAFDVPSVVGGDDDIVLFSPSSLGATTAGSYSLYLAVSGAGIDASENVNAVEFSAVPIAALSPSVAAQGTDVADFNGDGVVDSTDLVEFLDAVQSKNAPTRELPSLEDFLDAWFSNGG